MNYDPMCNETFHAKRGKGAFLNDNPIRVSDRPNLSKSVVGFDLSHAGDDGASNGLQVIQAMLNDVGSTWIMGSAALRISYAVAGRYDIYFNHGLEPWDQVAGLLLIEEDGGAVTDRTGSRAGLFSDGIITSSAGLHRVHASQRGHGMAQSNAPHRLENWGNRFTPVIHCHVERHRCIWSPWNNYRFADNQILRLRTQNCESWD